MTEFVCPRTQAVCTEPLCDAANETLVDAAQQVRRQLPDEQRQFGKIIYAIGRQISEYEDGLRVSLSPEVNEQRTAICPRDLIRERRDMGRSDDFIRGFLESIATKVVSGAVHQVRYWK